MIAAGKIPSGVRVVTRSIQPNFLWHLALLLANSSQTVRSTHSSVVFELFLSPPLSFPLSLSSPAPSLCPECSFLILACDGVWDVFTDDDAVSFVSQAMENMVSRIFLRTPASFPAPRSSIGGDVQGKEGLVSFFFVRAHNVRMMINVGVLSDASQNSWSCAPRHIIGLLAQDSCDCWYTLEVHVFFVISLDAEKLSLSPFLEAFLASLRLF